MKSINVFIATIGRETLKTLMLPSLVNQLHERDYLTIVSDDNHDFVAESISSFHFKCKVTHQRTETPLGYWGHGIRNAYQNTLEGDFISNADDDDMYVEGAFDFIREVINNDTKLYFFKVKDGNHTLWTTYDVALSNVGTSCGVIPNTKNLPNWGYFYGGDGHFYIELSKNMPYQFIDYVIYKTKNCLT